MFGLLFTLVSGGWFGKWLDDNLGSGSSDSQIKNLVSSNEPFVDFVNEDVWNRLKKFLKTYEGYHASAYDLRDGKITIGYGTTNWLTPAGKIIRPVRLGDTITETEASAQMRFFFADAIPNLNIYLKTNKLAVTPSFLVAMLNFCYMSGTGFLKWDRTKKMFIHASRNSNYSSVALNVKSNMLSFWKGIRFKSGDRRCSPSAITKYQCFGLSWSRRLSASLDVIQGVEKDKRWYDNNIKKAY